MIDSELINCESKWLEAGVLSDIYIIIVSISFKHFFQNEKKTFDILNTPLLLVGQNRTSSNPVIHFDVQFFAVAGAAVTSAASSMLRSPC